MSYLDARAIAERIGVTQPTVHAYHTRAKRNRAAGTPRAGDLPEPDQWFGNSPVWLEETVERWLGDRPGRGVGGGRPWWKEKRQPAE